MAGEVYARIVAFTQQKKVEEAIALCLAELKSREDPTFRPQVIAALCACLTAAGRADDAAIIYDQLRDELRRAGGGQYITAAIAARHEPDIRALFRERSSFYQDQHVGFSALSSLAAWSEQYSSPIVTIDVPEQVELPEGHRPYATDGYTCYKISSAEILSGWDFVLTPTGHLLRDSGYVPLATFYGVFPYAIADSLNLIAHIWPIEVEDVPYDALFLSSPRAFHVGHFMVDFLPRLRALEAFGPGAKVAIPREAPAKFLALLDRFGIKDDRIIFCDLGKRYRFRNLIVAKVGAHEKPNPRNVRFLRDTLAPARRTPSTIRGFYMHRRIGTRQVANQSEVDNVLREFNIQPIDLEGLSIGEQEQMLAQAGVLIGIYGSDLLSCLFAPYGAHAIELIWDEIVDTTIGPWCVLSGLHQQFLRCATTPDIGQRRQKKDRDIAVDCNVLRERLSQIAAQNI
jgi:hypothetical protein